MNSLSKALHEAQEALEALQQQNDALEEMLGDPAVTARQFDTPLVTPEGAVTAVRAFARAVEHAVHKNRELRNRLASKPVGGEDASFDTFAKVRHRKDLHVVARMASQPAIEEEVARQNTALLALQRGVVGRLTLPPSIPSSWVEHDYGWLDEELEINNRFRGELSDRLDVVGPVPDDGPDSEVLEG